jgi:hypothetical protein
VVENEALSEEVDSLCAKVDEALAVLAQSGPSAYEGEGWVDQVLHLESAKAILHGNGPGGDL